MHETEPSTDRSELLLRASRRGLMLVLAMLVILGATIIAHLVQPGTLLSDWPGRVPWLLPVAAVIVVVVLKAPFGKRGMLADSAEVRAFREDEFRQTNLARAQRLALIAVLVAQLPLALVLRGLTTESALMAMAVSSVILGMAVLVASFLYFDRE